MVGLDQYYCVQYIWTGVVIRPGPICCLTELAGITWPEPYFTPIPKASKLYTIARFLSYTFYQSYFCLGFDREKHTVM